MDIPKVFGTHNQWYDHMCRKLIWAVFGEGVTYCGCRLTPDYFCQTKENFSFPTTTLALAFGLLAEGKKMDPWGFPKEWKWNYYLKSRDKTHNASQADISSGDGGFLHENRRDYRGSQPSGGGFGGTTRSNSDFCFGYVPISVGGFVNTN